LSDGDEMTCVFGPLQICDSTLVGNWTWRVQGLPEAAGTAGAGQWQPL